MREQALHFAQALLDGCKSDRHGADRTRAFELALGRPPTAEELSDGGGFLTEYAGAVQAAGPEADARHAAWQSFCQMLFCMNEFLYVD